MTAVDRYFADRCPQLAAGIAYRVLFSIVPLAIVIVSICGLVLGNQEVNDVVVDTITRALPSTAATGRTSPTRSLRSRRPPACSA